MIKTEKIPCRFFLSAFWEIPGGFLFGDRFAADCIRHHPVFVKPQFLARPQTGRFCGRFRPLNSWISVSVAVRAFWRRLLAPRLCIQKIRSRRQAPRRDETRYAGAGYRVTFWRVVSAREL